MALHNITPCDSPAYSSQNNPASTLFYAGSNNQSQISVDGTLLVEQRARTQFRWASEQVTLEPGRHDIAIDFVGRPQEVEDEFADDPPPQIDAKLQVEFAGPGIDRQPIEAALLTATPTRSKAESNFEIEPSLVKAGRVLFKSKGCAACHDLFESHTKITSDIVATPLGELPLGASLAHVLPR